MRQAQLDSNADSSTRGKSLRPALAIVAGLIALGVAAAAVLDQPGQRTFAGSNPAGSSVVNVAAAPAESGSTNAISTSAIGSAKPHFERSDEPAVEESVNAHGG
jgi:hypothetical protein